MNNEASFNPEPSEVAFEELEAKVNQAVAFLLDYNFSAVVPLLKEIKSSSEGGLPQVWAALEGKFQKGDMAPHIIKEMLISELLQ